MPKFNKKDNWKVREGEQETNSGLQIFAGEIEVSPYDKKDWQELQKDYTKMRDGDAVVKTTLDILKYPILLSEYRLEGTNKEAIDYVYWVLNNIDGGFQNFKYHKLLALDYGLSLHEEIIKRGDNYNKKLTNRPIAYLPIQNYTINQFHYDEWNRFIGIKHERHIPERGMTLIDIDIEKLEYLSYNEEYQDVRGKSILRPVRMFWESKWKILESSVVNIQRGAGIPIIYHKGEASTADKAKIEQVGRTIATSRNSYVSMNEEKLRLDLIEPKSQSNALAYLEYLDKTLFYNVMAQFMTSGISQNGSRAATSEHKSSYDLAASYTLQILEKNYQSLSNRIIDMSYLGNIPDEEKPIFKFNSITQPDKKKMAEYLSLLATSGLLVKNEKDENYIREIIGLPTTTITENNDEVNIQDQEQTESQLTLNKKEKHRHISLESLEHEERVFSLESAEQHYNNISSKVQQVTQEILNKMIDEIYNQVKIDKTKKIYIQDRIMFSFLDELKDLYEIGFNRGKTDIKKELSKVSTSSTKLVNAPDTKKVNYKLERIVKRFFYNVKITIENKLESISDAFIEKKGGLRLYLDGLINNFKYDQDVISSEIEGSYIDGRGDSLKELSKEVQLFLYSARLDNNLCEVCGGMDGTLATLEEFNQMGIQHNHPVNPECLGNLRGENERCRCLLIPYK